MYEERICVCVRAHACVFVYSRARDRQIDMQTDRQTDRHESDYCGHLFRVSGVFPSTYHQGSAQ